VKIHLDDVSPAHIIAFILAIGAVVTGEWTLWLLAAGLATAPTVVQVVGQRLIAAQKDRPP
jgi:hypothetical protein